MPPPDIAIIVGDENDFAEGPPRTAVPVVEVAVTMLALDRVNASLYAENGVDEYWGFIAKERVVEVYRGRQQGGHAEKLMRSGDVEIQCASVPYVRLWLQRFFPSPGK